MMNKTKWLKLVDETIEEAVMDGEYVQADVLEFVKLKSEKTGWRMFFYACACGGYAWAWTADLIFRSVDYIKARF